MAFIILEDGSKYEGTLFGKKAPISGEVVFTTGMTGYQETLTDPSYCGQIVCMTYPLIGNVGINDLDMESEAVTLTGFVVSELCELPSNWQKKIDLDTFLREQGVTGISGVDTRALTRRIRTHGMMRARILEGEPTQADYDAVKSWTISGQVMQVTCKAPYTIEGDGDLDIAVVDFGVKRNLLSSLTRRGCTLKVFPADTDAQTILEAGCDGVVFTNGPGDPTENPAFIDTVRKLMDKMPAFGICLGHQLMALAMGGSTVKMKYGHHGANHPVKDMSRGTCSVTAQNHDYMVDPQTLPANAQISHVNWNDQSVEGVRYTHKDAFSVQFHPEASAGPCETAYLFDDYLDMVKRSVNK